MNIIYISLDVTSTSIWYCRFEDALLLNVGAVH